MKMVLVHFSCDVLPMLLNTEGNQEHVINAVITRNREFLRLSRSGSYLLHASSRWGGKGGEIPLAILFLFLRGKRDVFEGCF